MKKIVMFLLAASALFSCGLLTRQGAIQMNNTFVKINDQLRPYGEAWGNELREAVKTRDFRKLGPIRAKFGHFVDSCRQQVIAMKDVGGSEEFRSCEIDLLTFEKSIAEKDFKAFEELNEQTDINEISDLYNKLNEDAKPEKGKSEHFKMLQAAFAKKNGFKLIVDGASTNG